MRHRLAMPLLILLVGCMPVEPHGWTSRLQRAAPRPLPALPRITSQEANGRDVTVTVENTTPIPLMYLSVCNTEVQRFSKVWDGSAWVESDWDWCGTGMRFHRIAPGSTARLMIQEMHEDKPERLYTVLSHADEPKMRSLVLLYEEPTNLGMEWLRGD